ncbi:MAG: FMN-binding protein [Actinomycetota bacterium]|nr:FMN-binding protein [Actinomycetota bacterium]
MPSTPARMVLSVLVTCIVAAAGLAFTYQLTAERIAAQARLAEEKALQAVLPNATEFTLVGDDVLAAAAEAAGETRVDAVFVAESVSGEVGWGVKVAPRGYGGPMQMVVGLDRDGLVTGVSVITHNETPGLGSNVVTNLDFMGQFEGWNGADIDKAAKALDAVSGATKSSYGVRKGVLAAGHIYADVLGSAEGGSGQ